MSRRIRSTHLALAAIPCLAVSLAIAGLILVGLDEPSGLVVAGLGGMGIFWTGLPFAAFWARGPRNWRRLLNRRLRGRPGSPNDRRARLPSAVLVLQDGKAERAAGTVRDDLGLAFFDRERRVVVFEGVAHRYVIRGEDVVGFHPLCRGR